MNAVDAILQEFEQEAATTRLVLERIPSDRLNWRPHPKSRTLGELATHIAAMPGGVAEMAMLDTFDASQLPPPAAMTFGQLIPALEASIARVRAVLSLATETSLEEAWTMTAGGRALMTMPRRTVLRTIMLNHWYHHRGQLTVYLRELDVPLPAVYGPSADENPF